MSEEEVSRQIESEQQKKSTFSDFIQHKQQLLQRTENRLDPDKPDFGRLHERKIALEEEVRVLDATVDEIAPRRMKQINPEQDYFDSPPDDQQALRKSALSLGLREASEVFDEISQQFEDEYHEKFGGKGFKDMTVEEEEKARDMQLALDIRGTMYNEMVDFEQRGNISNATT